MDFGIVNNDVTFDSGKFVNGGSKPDHGCDKENGASSPVFDVVWPKLDLVKVAHERSN